MGSGMGAGRGCGGGGELTREEGRKVDSVGFMVAVLGGGEAERWKESGVGWGGGSGVCTEEIRSRVGFTVGSS